MFDNIFAPPPSLLTKLGHTADITTEIDNEPSLALRFLFLSNCLTLELTRLATGSLLLRRARQLSPFFTPPVCPLEGGRERREGELFIETKITQN